MTWLQPEPSFPRKRESISTFEFNRTPDVPERVRCRWMPTTRTRTHFRGYMLRGNDGFRGNDLEILSDVNLSRTTIRAVNHQSMMATC